MMKHVSKRVAIQTMIIALIKPKRDRQTDDQYKDDAHFKALFIRPSIKHKPATGLLLVQIRTGKFGYL